MTKARTHAPKCLLVYTCWLHLITRTIRVSTYTIRYCYYYIEHKILIIMCQCAATVHKASTRSTKKKGEGERQIMLLLDLNTFFVFAKTTPS